MHRKQDARRGSSGARRGALVIFGGTAAGQLLALLSAPVLSRVFTPEDFGVFTVVSGLVMTIGAVAALRFEMAVPLPKDERDAYSLVGLGLMSVIVTAVLGTGVVAIAGDQIAQAFDGVPLMPWLWFVPPTAALVGGVMLLNQLAVRQRRYGSIGLRNVVQAFGVVATQVVTGLLGWRPGGLVVGLGAGSAVGIIGLLKGARLRCADAVEGFRWRNLARVGSRFRRFPLLLAPSGLLNVAGVYAPILLIAYFYGAQVAGWLGLTQRVLVLPVMLIGGAVGQVYLAEAARAARTDPVRSLALFNSATRRLALAGAAIATVLIVAAPWAFPWVFGASWAESGRYAQALAVSLAVQLVASPVSQTLIIFERQLTQLSWDTGRLAVTCGAVLISRLLDQPALHAVWAFSIASGLAYGVSWLLSRATVLSPGDDGTRA